MTTPLPPTDPPAPDDHLAGEAELTALYRQLPQSEPSPALDAAVLQAAAKALTASENPLAVERRRHPRERGDWVRPKDLPLRDVDSIGVAPRARRRPPPWLLTLASAASLVLVVSVAWHMRSASTGSTPASTTTAESAASMSEPVAAMAAKPSPDQQAEAAANAVVAKPSTPAVLAAPARKLAKDTMMVRQAAPNVRMRSPSPPKQSPARDGAGSQVIATTHDAPVPMPPPPPPLAEVSAVQAFAAPPVPPAPPVEVMTAPVSLAPTQVEKTSTTQKATTAQQRELDDIRKLFADHHDEEAQQQLENFHRRYPQWELAEDLRVRLRKP